MFTTVFNQTLIFIILIVLGCFIAKSKLVPQGTDKALSTLEKNIFLPSLVLVTFIQQCTPSVFASSWRLLLFGCLLFVVVPIAIAISKGMFKNRDSQRLSTYALIFSNYGYMGNAMIIAIFPELFFDYTIFTFPVTILMYVWGIPTLLLSDDNKKGIKARLMTLVNPMLICMLIGIIIGLLQLDVPVFFISSIQALANCMSPLAMILTGMVIAKIDISKFLKKWRIYIVVAIKLLVFPLAYLLIVMWIPQGTFLTRSALICAMCYMTMPTGLNPIVLPLACGKDVSEAAGMALISHLFCVLTIPLMFMLLQNLVL